MLLNFIYNFGVGFSSLWLVEPVCANEFLFVYVLVGTALVVLYFEPSASYFPILALHGALIQFNLTENAHRLATRGTTPLGEWLGFAGGCCVVCTLQLLLVFEHIGALGRR